MLLSRKSLWFGLIAAAVLLGLFNLTFNEIGLVTLDTLTDPSILLLALGMGLIPIIGGAMEISGLMDDIVANIRMKTSSFMAFSPALVGMLPMPGGALLSAPLVSRGGEDVSPANKTAINVWFRHVLILIYPLAALLPTTKMARLNLYVGMLYLIPGFFLMIILGYFFLLRDIEGEMVEKRKVDLKILTVSLSPILIAPLLHFVLMNGYPRLLSEFYLVIAVSVGLFLAFRFGKLGTKDVFPVIRKMKPWNFALIIIGMFLFLNVFMETEMPAAISEIHAPKAPFLVAVGFLLGFATGRVQVPMTIMIPIYFSKYGAAMVAAPPFAIMFFSVFMGYVISPVHPCVTVTMEYFKVGYKDILRKLALPTALATVIVLAVAYAVL